MITDDTLAAGAAATLLRLASEPRRGRRGSMKYPGQEAHFRRQTCFILRARMISTDESDLRGDDAVISIPFANALRNGWKRSLA